MKLCRRCHHQERLVECVVDVTQCCECPDSQTAASATAHIPTASASPTTQHPHSISTTNHTASPQHQHHQPHSQTAASATARIPTASAPPTTQHPHSISTNNHTASPQHQHHQPHSIPTASSTTTHPHQ